MSPPHLPLTSKRIGTAMTVGGCDLEALATEFGTPLQVVDAADIDDRVQQYRSALDGLPRPARAVFATKALPILAVVARLARAGIGADVTTTGELTLARRAGVPPATIVSHGNARSIDELAEVCDAGVGLVVLDGPQDLEHLASVATRSVDVLLRITPGIAPATHQSMATAHHGQKFGVTLDEAPALIRSIAASPTLRLRGVHFHVGSQITALGPFAEAIARVARLGSFEILDAGGGLGVPFTPEMATPSIAEHVAVLDSAMVAGGFDAATELIVEPGRALVARAVVTVYRVRTVKHTAGRTFVAVDGGTSDDSEVVTGLRTAAPFALAPDEHGELATLVGLHCDSGDVLAENVRLPPLAPGDLVVMPGTGAYTCPLASNYNCATRPAVVEVTRGRVRVIVRRETLDDLFARHTI